MFENHYNYSSNEVSFNNQQSSFSKVSKKLENQLTEPSPKDLITLVQRRFPLNKSKTKYVLIGLVRENG